MKIDFTNFFKSSPVSENDFLKSREILPEFLSKIKEREQDFYQIFDNESFLAEVAEIKKFTDSVQGKFQDIIVCGMGGSALGTLAIQEALGPKFSRDFPRLHVLENIDVEIISELTGFLDFSRTLFIIISKSGTTIETVSQYEYFRGILTEKNLELKNHLIFITGKSGFLYEESTKLGVKTFSVPKNIGGRFSVLTAVGLLPSALIGINIDELLAGAKEISRDFLNPDFNKNLPFQLATSQFLAKKSQNVLMPYSAKLRNFTNWWAQLLAESTGKDAKGITPIPAQGVTDQHSLLQLFIDGPKDKLIIFIKISRDFKKSDLNVFEKLMSAELQGTAQSLTEKKRPNLTIEITEISPRNLGKLFMLFMGATAFLGEYMEINAFNQPGVERGKVLTREILY